MVLLYFFLPITTLYMVLRAFKKCQAKEKVERRAYQLPYNN